MPYHVLLALSGWSAPITGHQAVVPAYAYRLGLVAVLLNALASPFLYAYRSRRIQREVRRLFGLPPKSKKRTGKAVGLHRELTNSSSGHHTGADYGQSLYDNANFFSQYSHMAYHSTPVTNYAWNQATHALPHDSAKLYADANPAMADFNPSQFQPQGLFEHANSYGNAATNAAANAFV